MRIRACVVAIAFLLVGAAYGLTAMLTPGIGGLDDASEQPLVLPLEDPAWRDSAPGMPAGARYTVVAGDPAKAGPYVMRVELPPGYVLPPYSRPNDEHIVVLAGTLDVGSGATIDPAAMRRLSAGTYRMYVANARHYATTRDGATLQVSGTGPLR
jgi:quercetin dioxygenase-like cupin family protein